MSEISANVWVLLRVEARSSRLGLAEARRVFRSFDAPSASTPVATAPAARPPVTTQPAQGIDRGGGGGGAIGGVIAVAGGDAARPGGAPVGLPGSSGGAGEAAVVSVSSKGTFWSSALAI